ncbi:hypothetical protein ACFSSA_04930 [Luteolibacter algae]|uniref:PEP-CTERM protein-sorting domain-containing protein n=1 Tax=Luteolibacter algae TaxID=454151 RepID=A0ABW5D4L1_9BACT
MKFILNSIFLSGIFAVQSASAALTVAWSEDFNSYTTPGTDLNGVSTATGTGTFDTTSGVVANGSGGVTLTADTNRQQLAIENATAALAGRFTFDITHDVVPDPATNNSIFLQMTEGGRSTGSNEVADFAYTLNGGAVGTTPVTFNIFFNVTGADFAYTAPDNTMQTLVTGAYDVWIDNTRTTTASSDTNAMGGLPVNGVKTLFLQTFNGQEGNVYTFDNMSFSVPEPGSALLGMIGGLLLLRRRR